jgi:hypothetical protein
MWDIFRKGWLRNILRLGSLGKIVNIKQIECDWGEFGVWANSAGHLKSFVIRLWNNLKGGLAAALRQIGKPWLSVRPPRLNLLAPDFQLRSVRMRYMNNLSRVVVLVSVAVFAAVGPARAVEPSSQVSVALADLEKWLGSSDFGKTWNTYLLTDQLKAALAKPDQADPKKLSQVLARYDSGTPGLNKPRFTAVRSALAQWVEAREESTLPARAELPKMAEKIQDQLGAKTDADVARSKVELQVAVSSLGKYLDAHGRKGNAWKQYLLWPRLTAALAAKTPDNQEFKAVLDRFEADKDGLEMSQYIAVRNALR